MRVGLDVVATPDVIPAKAGIQGNRRTPGGNDTV
jgi:hypothetical protein